MVTRLAPGSSFALFFLSLAVSPLAAQQTTDAKVLQERLAGKLAAPFLRHAAWHTDKAAAQRAAAQSGKLIFCHFTRSFIPCGTSIRCEKDVLSTQAFEQFAKDVELYCHVTAHVDAAADRLLFETGGSGWPHHVLIDASGRVVARHSGEKTVASFRKMLANARHYLAVEARSKREIEAACKRQFEAGMAAGALSLAEARSLYARLGRLEGKDRERCAQSLTELEIRTMAGRVDRFDEKTHAAVGRHFYIMHRAGRLPASRNTRRDFWGGVLAYLETREKPDLEIYASGLAVLEKEFGKSAGYKRFLAAKKGALKKLREKARTAAANPGKAGSKAGSKTGSKAGSKTGATDPR